MNRPTDPPTHPPKGGSVSTNPSSKNTHPWDGELTPQIPNLLNGIEISWFVQVLLHSLLISPVLTHYPPMGVGGEWGSKWVESHPVHTHAHGGVHPLGMHACTRMCTHTCMHVEHDKHGCLHGGGHLQFPNMFILAFSCMCVHARAHV